MKVGDKVKGFDFDPSKYAFGNSENKKKYIDKEGVVGTLAGDFFTIDFEDNWWLYPLELAHLAQIEWQPKQGEMIEVSWCGKEWRERIFISKHKDKFVFETLDGDVCIWEHARPINPIQREIEELEEKIKELKLKL